MEALYFAFTAEVKKERTATHRIVVPKDKRNFSLIKVLFVVTIFEIRDGFGYFLIDKLGWAYKLVDILYFAFL